MHERWSKHLDTDDPIHSMQATARQMHFTENLARRLCKEATLPGHTGCVQITLISQRSAPY